VEAENPYWTENGAVTVEDPDRWRVVLMPQSLACLVDAVAMIRLGVPADLSATSDVYRSASLSNAGDHDNLLAHPEYLVLGPEGLAEGRTYVAEEEGSLLAGCKNGGSPGSARTRTPAATGRSSAPSPTLTWPARRRFE
jgi:YycE-like C-terminal domain